LKYFFCSERTASYYTMSCKKIPKLLVNFKIVCECGESDDLCEGHWKIHDMCPDCCGNKCRECCRKKYQETTKKILCEWCDEEHATTRCFDVCCCCESDLRDKDREWVCELCDPCNDNITYARETPLRLKK